MSLSLGLFTFFYSIIAVVSAFSDGNIITVKFIQ